VTIKPSCSKPVREEVLALPKANTTDPNDEDANFDVYWHQY
jgi:hypothetical protein